MGKSGVRHRTGAGTIFGIWVGWLDRTHGTATAYVGGEYRAFFGRPGKILYQGTQTSPKIMGIDEDGNGPGPRSRTLT